MDNNKKRRVEMTTLFSQVQAIFPTTITCTMQHICV